jgi:hypothetical protein
VEVPAAVVQSLPATVVPAALVGCTVEVEVEVEAATKTETQVPAEMVETGLLWW